MTYNVFGVTLNPTLLLCEGQALVEAGESYRQLAEVKYSMEDNVKQNFLDPLAHIQNKDLKEVNVSFLPIICYQLSCLGVDS